MSATPPHSSQEPMIGRASADDEASGAASPSHVVGVGASAGGLEALELFFSKVPADTSMAFVVIQHLSPSFKSLMDELLARQTSLPIHVVNEKTDVRAGHVYLLPPAKRMIIAEGRLLVTDKDAGEGFFLPIDHFFRSLGQDLGERSIAIVLSGTGGDGSRGIKHVHEGGGLVIAQSERSAAFDGMPRAAQSTGLVDLVMTPQEIPVTLQKYAEGHSDWRASATKNHPPIERVGVEAIIEQLRREYGIDFSLYKLDMIQRRIERRLLIADRNDVDAYAEQLAGDEGELSALYRDLLVGVTDFFRDQEAYAALERQLPRMIDRLDVDEELRVWVPATATGEEAYSIAILICEAFAAKELPVRCRIFATDVHQASLDFASQGLYPETRLRGVNLKRRHRYFRKEAGGFRVSPEIRQFVVFATHNVISDAPFTKLHLISCRNLFIYLKPEVQCRVLTLFHFGLRLGGTLWLGSSEVPTELDDEFEALDSAWRLYSKRRDVRLTSRVRMPQPTPRPQLAPVSSHRSNRPDSGLLGTYDRLLEVYMPPSMLVTEHRRLVQCFSGASSMLHPVDGRASDDIADQLDSSLRIPLGTTIRKAARDRAVVEFGGVMFPTDDGPKTMRLRTRPIEHAAQSETLFLVEFHLDENSDNEPAPDKIDLVDAQVASSEQVASLEKELSFARQSLNATIEELQSANEEMQGTNEELVASNEELQSTNEELHSVNEELYTVNGEYQRKIAELTEMTDDMDNLLNSTHVDTIFLDRDLRVRKFTPDVAEKFSLLRQDIGRNFESFTYRLDDDDLISELRGVLATEKPFEREVRDRKSNVYLMRILPYTSRGNVEGVVLTLVDITNLKHAQARLAELSEIVQQATEAIFRVDREGMIRTWNDGARRLFDRDDSVVGDRLASLFPPDMHDDVDDMLGELATSGRGRHLQIFEDTIRGRQVFISASLSPVHDDRGKLAAASFVARDVTDRVLAEAKIHESIERRDQFLAMLSHELRNPLGAIANAARLIESETDSDSKREASKVVIRQSEQMARLLDDLLDVSRITLGKIELRKKVFDLGDIIDEAVRVIGPAFEDGQLEFHFDRCVQPLWVDGDPARLQQVMVNLLRNAVKYTPPGGLVRLVTLKNRDAAEIRVLDTGVGISDVMQDKIFDMFVQANSSLVRSQGGIGLGLTLVRAVVEMHGGTIEVFSEGEGHGCEFRVDIPLTTQTPQPVAAPAAKVTLNSVAIVEDIPDAREMLAELLELQGYEVHAAGDGEAGLELIASTRPDVALIDIGLPKLDGYEVARRLREEPSTADLFLVALTGYGQAKDAEAVCEAGFDGHLVKPLDFEKLTELLSDR